MLQHCGCFCFQAEDGIRDLVRSRGLGDVYKRQRSGSEFTGGVAGIPCFREGKIARVEAWLAGLGHDWRRFGRSWFYSDSVSYTHLRAHETVLELVCRLLLEKKKTQNI